MSPKTNRTLVADGSQRRPSVRVRSHRITADSAKLYPPNGQGKIWWGSAEKSSRDCIQRLRDCSLHQLQAAAQFPGSGISEVGNNAALAFIEGFAPRNEVEASLAVQMACTHAAMSVLAFPASPRCVNRRS
jgi:hypothetical protein